MKKFITTISLQGKDLTPVVYGKGDSDTIVCDKAVSYPILNIINNYTENGEKIEICPILITKDSDDNKNLETFKNELDEIASEKGFTYEIKPIKKSINDTIDDLLKLFSDLIGIVEDNDDLSACITYGTKPVSVVTIMALNYAYKVKENTSINRIVYGTGPWDGSKIYDVTPLFYIDSAVNHLAKMKLSNPEEALRTMLNLDTEE